MALDVKVTISLTGAAGSPGFGYPLLLTAGAGTAIGYTECSSIADVVTAGYAATTDTYKAASLLFSQNNAPSKIAVCSGTETATELIPTLLDKGWRQLIVIALGTSTVAQVSTLVESYDDRMYFTSVDDTEDIPSTSSEYDRTVILYYDVTKTSNTSADVVFPEAALVGATAGLSVGGYTYKNIIIKGLPYMILTDAEITTVHTAGALTILSKAGDVVTSEGKAVGGEYIDNVDCKDYVIQQLTYNTQKLLNTVEKIPYDDTGIAQLEAVAVSVMQDCWGRGIIATTADGAGDYSVNYALREDTTSVDRTARKYIGGAFTFALAGAVHEVEITGEITI